MLFWNLANALSASTREEHRKIGTKSLGFKVAEIFGREHKNVLRDISNLECSEEFNRLNFEPVEYLDAKGEKRPAFEMTKNGFVFLAMGFTGAKAAEFKEAYINAFDAMEKALRSIPFSLDDAQKLRALRDDVLANWDNPITREEDHAILKRVFDSYGLPLKTPPYTPKRIKEGDDQVMYEVLVGELYLRLSGE